MELTHGSLFAGIGGFDLGFERAGFKSLWQVEIDPYCLKVLEKHFPHAKRYTDVRFVHGVLAHAKSKQGRRIQQSQLSSDTGTSCEQCLAPITVITGGFPCQPFSVAGKRRGAADDRWLWPQMRRVIEEVRPRFVVAENVLGIIKMVLDQVLSDLEALGYATGAVTIPACAVDAPHRRERLWIVAHRNSSQRGESSKTWTQASGLGSQERGGIFPPSADVANTERGRCETDRECRRVEEVRGRETNEPMSPTESGADVADTSQQLLDRHGHTGTAGRSEHPDSGRWFTEPNLCGVDDGLPKRLDGCVDASHRMDSVGGAPQVPENVLRALWLDGAGGFAPQGRESDEQLTRQLAHALSTLPHDRALANWQAGVEAARQVCDLRQASTQIGLLRNAQQSLSSAWIAAPRQAKEWAVLAVSRGSFVMEWPGVPRVAHGIPCRVDRLKCLGNAVVPQVAEEIAWMIRRVIESNASA